MTTWISGPRLALDSETTAPDPLTAHLVTACVLDVNGDGEVVERRDWLADPGIEIPEEAAAVHGISTEHAREHGRPEAEVIAEILDLLAERWSPEVPVVAYNACFDLTLIGARAQALGLADGLRIRGPVLDALTLDRIVNRYRKGKRKLAMNCERYGVTLSEDDAHSADADARAAHDLTWAMATRHPEISSRSLRELYVFQRQGHRAWAQNFQQWLRAAPRREDETDEEEAARRVVEINCEWPMIASAIAVPLARGA